MEPEKILSSASPDVAKLVEQVLEIERDYQYHKNLDENRALVREVSDKIAKLFE
jgi:hypothetical protein